MPESRIARRRFLTGLLGSVAVSSLSGCITLTEQGGQLIRNPADTGIEPALYRHRFPPTAERVVVVKHLRRLYLYSAGKVVREYKVSLGGDPIGHKTRKGDNRTPEGNYVIDWRNATSAYHLSLHISYPNEQDLALAKARGVDPGGMIMIHGLPNGKAHMVSTHRRSDWTNGCIAVTNEEIEELWASVPDGTPIEIRK